MEEDGRAEDAYQTRLQNVQRETADAEARLENLLARERQQTDTVAGLENSIAARSMRSLPVEDTKIV